MQKTPPTDATKRFAIFIEIFKIGVVIILLLLGIHITLWIIDTVDAILHSAERLSLFQLFMELESKQQILNVSFNNDVLSVRNNDVFKWIFLLLLFIILFNAVGKTIVAILHSMSRILISVNLTPHRPASRLIESDEQFLCEYCNTPYNPSEYRRGTTLRCGNCNKIIRPPS